MSPAPASVRGFTLIESVVAVAVLALLVATAAAAVGTTRRAGAAVAVEAERAQVRAAAEAILATEVRRAGFVRPEWDAAESGAPFGGAAGLEIALGDAHPDQIEVRYHDERFRAAPTEVTAAFSAGRDGRGRWNLYRRVGSGSRQPTLEGIDLLAVAALTRSGVPAAPAPGVWNDVEAVTLTLSFVWGERRDLLLVFGAPLEVTVR